MAYVDRIKPEDYSAITAAFVQVGAPVFARVALIINAQRKAAGNSKRISYRTLKKAWHDGWAEQEGGRPAPALKTLFVNAPPVSYRHDRPETVAPPVETDSKEPLVRAGAASMGAYDAEGQPIGAARHDRFSDTLPATLPAKETAMIPGTSAATMSSIDRLAEVARRIEEGLLPSRSNEMAVLAGTRRNLLGLQEVSGTIIAELVKKKPFLVRMVTDLECSDMPTLRTVRETLRELGQFEKELTLAIKNNQEAQRLLEGAPQRIEEHRGKGGDEADTRALARLARMLRTRMDTGERYDGEETGDVQDAEFTDGASAEKVVDVGQEKANEEEPAA